MIVSAARVLVPIAISRPGRTGLSFEKLSDPFFRERQEGIVDFLFQRSDALDEPGIGFPIAPHDDQHAEDENPQVWTVLLGEHKGVEQSAQFDESS
jgi:hypothetical protein